MRSIRIKSIEDFLIHPLTCPSCEVELINIDAPILCPDVAGICYICKFIRYAERIEEEENDS